jgi:dihydrofolate synthase/folylpolyglutamate synthase
MITEEAFASLVVRLDSDATFLEDEHPELGRFTAFELLTAMALTHFAASGCDVAVVEVGMGGSLDSTNVVTPAVSVITTLDYEHTAVLGSTLAEIAANKAGIIKPGRPVAVAEQQSEALAVIETEARRNESQLGLAGRDWRVEGDWRRFAAVGPWGSLEELRTGIAGCHQMANAALALAAVTAAGEGFDVPAAAVRYGIGSAALPGRFEVVMVDEHTLVLDGAHTPLAATALAETFLEAFPGRRAVLVLGLAEDKRVEEIVTALAPISARVVATAAASPRAMETGRIVEAFQRYTAGVEEAQSVAEALAMARRVASTENPIVITGSFHVVSEAREAFGLAVSDFTAL